MSTPFSKRSDVVRTSWFGGLVLFLCLLSGCNPPPYPPEMTYPLRTDWLVESPPSAAPEHLPTAGKIDEYIAQLRDRGGKVHNPADISADQQAKLLHSLHELFGTPATPKAGAWDDEARSIADALQLHDDRLAEGSKLYRRHCLQCHGLTGDGRGPTGLLIFPLPRDLRQGIFKFVSSEGTAARKPTQADLLRLLRIGIDKTSMPPFGEMNDQQLGSLVAYTVHLSVRGEVEYRIMRAMLREGEEELSQEAMTILARKRTSQILRDWQAADSSTITPATMPTPESDDERMTPAHFESVRRGHKLFTDRGASGCISCHENYGNQTKYLYDLWGVPVRPSNLTEGAFRGGKTPLDLFHRIRGGISASGMPAVSGLPENEVWDLVHFVQAMPYPRLLPPDVREKVYPQR